MLMGHSLDFLEGVVCVCVCAVFIFILFFFLCEME